MPALFTRPTSRTPRRSHSARTKPTLASTYPARHSRSRAHGVRYTPCTRTTVPSPRLTCSALATSTRVGTRRGDPAAESASASASLRYPANTVKPRRSNSSAASLPSPDDAPVTSTAEVAGSCTVNLRDGNRGVVSGAQPAQRVVQQPYRGAVRKWSAHAASATATAKYTQERLLRAAPPMPMGPSGCPRPCLRHTRCTLLLRQPTKTEATWRTFVRACVCVVLTVAHFCPVPSLVLVVRAAAAAGKLFLSITYLPPARYFLRSC